MFTAVEERYRLSWFRAQPSHSTNIAHGPCADCEQDSGEMKMKKQQVLAPGGSRPKERARQLPPLCEHGLPNPRILRLVWGAF